MQVETLPAPLAEASTPLPSAEPTDLSMVTAPLPSEECEQPTFHVMQPPLPTPTAAPMPIASVEATAVPVSTGTFTPLVAVPITSETPIAPNPNPTVVPAPAVKPTKRGSRSSQNHKQIARSPAKPPTLLARPSIGKPSPILPQPQKPTVFSNQMAPLVPKPVSTNGQVVKQPSNNPSAGFTTYLVVDGNQGQLIQVANDGQKPVTFRNQAGQILQATPITVVSAANQPAAPSFQTNGDTSILTNTSQINTFQQQQQQQQTAVTSLAAQQSVQNSSQTVTTVRTSSSIDTTTMTTQQVTGITQLPANTSLLSGCNIVSHQPSLLQPTPMIPTSILNGNTLQTHDRDMSPIHNDNDSSLDETSGLDASTADPNLSLSLSQLASKVNHRHRRSSSSSLSKKKRGRPRLYERDPFTNKPIKSRPMPEGTELTIPNVTTTTLLMPSQTTTTTYNHVHPHPTGCTSLIFPTQPMSQTTTIPVNNPSLLQQQSYSYPSLLNGNASATSMLTAPTLNIFSNNNLNNPPLSSSTSSYPYSCQPTTILPPPLPPPPPPPLQTTTNGLSRTMVPPITHTVENQAIIPLKNLQISSTSSPTTSSPRPSMTNSSTATSNVAPLNTSPIKSLNQTQNNDVVVHYIGGFVIRESSHPFPLDDHEDSFKDLNISNGKEKEKENHSFNENTSDLGSDQLRCIFCKKVDFSERFFNQEKKICSKSCSTKSSKSTKITNGKKAQSERVPPIIEPVRSMEHSMPPKIVETQIEEPISASPDHGLPQDPSKWSVFQVGEFIARLTNETIREAFYESEMDGQALLLMTQEHLRDTMKIKLGPSLIIASEIAKLRERARTFSS